MIISYDNFGGKMFIRFRIILIYIFITIAIAFNCTKGPDEAINITVSKGTLPIYSWNQGSLHFLAVYDTDREVAIWAINTPNSNKINSPVIHGEIPQEAIIFKDIHILGSIDTTAYNKPLEIGKNYRVVVRKYGIYSEGWKTFTCNIE